MPTSLDYENTLPIRDIKRTLPEKILVSPGPTNFSPGVLAALADHTLGSTCKELYQLMDDIIHLLNYAFQTKNDVTLALQTSGTGGIEAAICNVVNPGETVIVAVAGFWGERTVDKAKARGADVVRLATTTGEIFSLESLENAIVKYKPVVLCVTHGESSGGTVQTLEGLGSMCHKYDCLLIVDAVVSLGGVPFFTDKWEIDIAVSATQKAIGSPPGLSLITMSPRAVARMEQLRHPPPFYYNIKELCKMWWTIPNGKKGFYVTYNSHQLNALRQALIELVEEGLINRWERHRMCAERFWTGMKKLGMRMVVENEENRLTVATCYLPPAHIDSLDLINYLETRHIVVGFSVSKLASNSLRIGFLCYNARPELVDHVLKCIEEGIQHCAIKAKSNNSEFINNEILL